MRFIFLLLLFSFSSFSLFPQEEISVHKMHKLEFGSPDKLPSLFDPDGKGIIPLQYDKSGLTKNVFGYLPDWEYSTSKQYLQYSLLTHIAAFDFVVSSTGAISNPSYWPWTDVINLAHQNGVKIILCAVCFDTAAIRQLLTNSTVKQTFFTNVKNLITQYQMDGVNVDFEGMGTSLRGSILNTFMQDLSTYIHTQLPGKEVSFAGPAVNWGGWVLSGLAAACDYIFIMGYDFYGSWSTTTGPSSPLTGGTYNITNTINTQWSAVTNSTPEKLILGIPYFGAKWKARTSSPHATVQSWVSSTRFRDDAINVVTYGKQWASDNQVPWYRWQISDTSWYQVWFDNDSSLGLKYNLAEAKNLRGVGMWALGYDGARMELWNELQRRYFVPVELISFTAVSNANSVLLNWVTATELNNKGFLIQKADSKNPFLWKDAGFVNGFGSSAEQKKYTFIDNNLPAGRWKYRLIQIDFDGTKKEIANTEIDVLLPTNAKLEQNFPNPFNPSTSIKFSIKKKDFVSLTIYDLLGKEIIKLVNEEKDAGIYEVHFNPVETFQGLALQNGVYFYQLKAGNYIETKKMILLK